MAEDPQQAQNINPVTDPQESPMPSDKQQEVDSSEPSKGEEELSEGLPEDAKERTKREFEKVKQDRDEYRKSLQEERARRKYYETLVSQAKPQKQEPQVQFIDPLTGLPNEEALTTLSRQSQEALQIAQEARQRNLELQRDQENKAVYAVYPELNPDAKEFNQDLHNLTRSIALDSMLNPNEYGNKELSFSDAATRAKKILLGNTEVIKQQAATEAIEQLTPKEQASLAADGSPSRRGMTEDLDELRARSRGKDEAARLARIERFNKIMEKQE